MENQKSLLIVDDDEDDRTWIMGAIRHVAPAACLIEARDGKEALKYILDGFKPNLVLLDLNMPRMNGFEFLQSLDKIGMKNIPVIAVSTSDRPEDMRKAIRLGAVHYIIKPFSNSKLAEKINEVLTVFLNDGKSPLPLETV